MSAKYEKLKTLLKELFQLDQPDLDFGIYRVLHAKSGEITQFLDKDLLPQVSQAFAAYKSSDRAEIEKQLTDAIAQAESLGVPNPEDMPKVQDLRSRLATESVDIGKLESEVYDHLFGFFRRYYSEGDFLSKRVYKPGVYAVPYEGEEVKLHWANADQYYIKTSEYLRDFAFRLDPDADELWAEDPMRVHFRLVDAAEGEHGNVKESEATKRVFILAGGEENEWITEEKGELVVKFEYRPATLTDWADEDREGKAKPPDQKTLLDIAEKRILGTENGALLLWVGELRKPHVKADGEESDKSRLAVNLSRYTARNTFDYFVHKDLGGFLRRELDFYIKNEVMHLDDIESETAPRVEQYLSKIKIIRIVAHKITDFLAQLEDFQKKLWLKKKFVVETSWCIRVGIIPEEFYDEIAANEAQRKEWVDSLSIDEIKGDLTSPAYSTPLTVEFLRAHSTLVIDTRRFSEEFRERVLDALDQIDEQTDGILIQSENFQALSVIATRNQRQIECVHIDPPYNTATSAFPYKNDYQHSSWLSMIADRLSSSVKLLTSDGSLLCHIDENEYERLHNLCNDLSLPDGGTIIWDKRNPMLGRKGVATQHEYVLWRTFLAGPLYLRNANQRLILQAADRIIAKHGSVNDATRAEFARWVNSCTSLSGGERFYRSLEDDGRVYRGVAMGAPELRTDPKFFIPLIHPKTQKPCPVPPNGFSRTPETLRDLVEKNEILFGDDETVQPQRKVFLTEDSQRQVSSVIQDAGRGKADVDKLGLEFPYCHPVSLYIELVGAAAPTENSTVLDFFAGSGTNGHAVIALNRDENTKRKVILVEVGDQFDKVLVPRLKKVTFSPEWRDGKPTRFATAEEAERSPRIMKILRLESYEDALNNLELRRTEEQERTLFSKGANENDDFREQYMLRYMLDVESRDSQSLLNIAAFTDPTAYKLKVKLPGSDESRVVNVDLIETFNWLIGLTIKHIAASQKFSTAFKRDTEGRIHLDDRLRKDLDGPFWFRSVDGSVPDGRKTLVIWRKLTGNPEEDNLVLDEWFTRQGYSSRDSEYDLIYVNGDNNLENLKAPDDTWKVRLIEEDFHRLMFDTEDV